MNPSTDWSRDELKAAIEAYLEMLHLHRTWQPFIKKQVYQQLSEQHGRTVKSWEFRAQNISHVLSLQGREWLPGLPPAKHVGTNVIRQIEELLAECQGVEPSWEAVEAAQALAERKKVKLSEPPAGNALPETETIPRTSYKRDPKVRAWVLENAKGICEACGQPAPFTTESGDPFLEVHHLRRLADGGSDTVDNALAVCPNCHRALHHAKDRFSRTTSLMIQLSRPIKNPIHSTGDQQ